jgi:hypothetical protein
METVKFNTYGMVDRYILANTNSNCLQWKSIKTGEIGPMEIKFTKESKTEYDLSNSGHMIFVISTKQVEDKYVTHIICLSLNNNMVMY